MSRDVVSTHYHQRRFRECPVCQGVIDREHTEALLMEATAQELEATFRRAYAFTQQDVDFVILPARNGGPNDTQPPERRK
jgi:hypothetical protein